MNVMRSARVLIRTAVTRVPVLAVTRWPLIRKRVMVGT